MFGRGHRLGEALERLHHRDARLPRLDRVALDVAAVVELLDDVVARGLRAEAELLHHLDQLALADARRRLGLLRVDPRVRRGRRPRRFGSGGSATRPLGERELLALLHLRDLLVLRAPVWIDREEPGLDEHVAAHEVGLRPGLDVGPRRLGHRRVGERRQEAAHHQLVDLAVAVVGQHARVERLRRVDRRVVGGLLLAARRLEGLARSERRRLLERGHLRDRLQQLAHRERLRVDGVVGARIGDEPVHVEVLRDAHRARRGDARPTTRRW